MNPVGRIAVGFDGSPDAEAAVRWAMTLAKQTEAEVIVVHAVGLLEHAADRGWTELEEAVTRLTCECANEPAQVRWHVGNGDPCSVLLRAGAEVSVAADLLVVGSRGHDAHPGMLLGSTGLELAEHSPVPVVIVPSEKDGRLR